MKLSKMKSLILFLRSDAKSMEYINVWVAELGKLNYIH